MSRDFWKGRRVLITGHSGFKGGWLSLWLTLLGAEVAGYALKPPTHPNFFEACRLEKVMTSIDGDVRDYEYFAAVCAQFQPELVVHMAAQALVGKSYQDPIETYATNVMGTVHTLEMPRHCPSIRAVLIITSDKCYENREWAWGYREIDPMGGHDPYACSKGCAELITASYRDAFFSEDAAPGPNAAIASARAGNVIGGGDWATDRLLPDIFRSVMQNDPVRIRYPAAVRPWQHVLDPLNGYITLLERLYQDGKRYAGPWNFGPPDENCLPVSFIVQELKRLLGNRFVESKESERHFHEAGFLKLDCSKARQSLNWASRLNLSSALAWSAAWYQAFETGEDVAALSRKQIRQFEAMV